MNYFLKLVDWHKLAWLNWIDYLSEEAEVVVEEVAVFEFLKFDLMIEIAVLMLLYSFSLDTVGFLKSILNVFLLVISFQ